MYNNRWFKLALVSFVGIIISVFALGLLSTMNPSQNGHGMSGMGGTPPAGAYGGGMIPMGGMSGMSGMTPMGGMGTMPGMGASPMPMGMGGMPMGPGFYPQSPQEAYYLQQIDNLQRQIMELRQLIDQQGGGGSGGGMGGMSMM